MSIAKIKLLNKWKKIIVPNLLLICLLNLLKLVQMASIILGKVKEKLMLLI
jgi:hypothetical protein